MTPWDGPVNWAGMSHPRLYHAATANSDPAAAYELGRAWAELGADMVEQARALAGRILATEAGWEGEAAESVRAATLALTRWCDDAGTSALALGECVTEQAAAVEAVRTLMPEPGDFDWDAALGSFGGAGDAVAAVSDLRGPSERARTALERAVDVMTEFERWSARIDEAIPVCPPPPGPAGGGTGAAGGAEGVGLLPGTLPETSPETLPDTLPGTGTEAGSPPAPPGEAAMATAAGRTDAAMFGGGSGAAEGRVVGGPAVSGGPAVPADPSPDARALAVPAERGRVDVPAQGGAPGGGRAPSGLGGGSGMVGAPGAAGAGGASGFGQSGEHRTAGFLKGEKLFEPLPGIVPVIGDNWMTGDDDPD